MLRASLLSNIKHSSILFVGDDSSSISWRILLEAWSSWPRKKDNFSGSSGIGVSAFLTQPPLRSTIDFKCLDAAFWASYLDSAAISWKLSPVCVSPNIWRGIVPPGKRTVLSGNRGIFCVSLFTFRSSWFTYKQFEIPVYYSCIILIPVTLIQFTVVDRLDVSRAMDTLASLFNRTWRPNERSIQWCHW